MAEISDHQLELRDHQTELLGRLERLEEASSVESISHKQDSDHLPRMVAKPVLAAALPLMPKVTREMLELLGVRADQGACANPSPLRRSK